MLQLIAFFGLSALPSADFTTSCLRGCRWCLTFPSRLELDLRVIQRSSLGKCDLDDVLVRLSGADDACVACRRWQEKYESPKSTPAASLIVRICRKFVIGRLR